MKKLLGVLLFVLFAVGVIHAQAVPSSVAASAAVTQAVSVQSAPFNVDAATNTYMAELTPVQRANSDAYFEGGYWLTLRDFVVALGVAWLLLGTRLSAPMRSFAGKWNCTWTTQT